AGNHRGRVGPEPDPEGRTDRTWTFRSSSLQLGSGWCILQAVSFSQHAMPCREPLTRTRSDMALGFRGRPARRFAGALFAFLASGWFAPSSALAGCESHVASLSQTLYADLLVLSGKVSPLTNQPIPSPPDRKSPCSGM